MVDFQISLYLTALHILWQTGQAIAIDECSKHCDEYVSVCLILAQGYLDQSKCAMAEELCQKCLICDHSCAKAWELLGQAMEKEGDYATAANHFQKVSKYDICCYQTSFIMHVHHVMLCYVRLGISTSNHLHRLDFNLHFAI